MKLYSENKNYKLYQGNMLDMLEVIEPNTIDSIVTDPPYELNFMSKSWDNSGIAFQKETWKKCYEVLKPGGYLLAFGGSRTFHRIACAIEDAGFEIRDTIMWLYGSGFPKSMNIGLAIDKKNGVESEAIATGKSGSTSKAFNLTEEQEKAGTGILAGEYQIKKARNKWDGWGTALKPSFEPIIVARKPFKGSLVDNVIEYGVGGINIDECRVGSEVIKGGTMPDFRDIGQKSKEAIGIDKLSFGQVENAKRKPLDDHIGRFPANTILTYDETPGDERLRYFYCAKASKKDRDEGLDEFELKGAKELLNREENSDGASWNGKYTSGNAYAGSGAPKKNTHPTVKPTDLMQYLIRLVTPNGGTILDPFNGSGSTGKAVMYENREKDKNYKYIGIELTEEYLPITKARIEYVCNLEKEVDPQLSLFDL